MDISISHTFALSCSYIAQPENDVSKVSPIVAHAINETGRKQYSPVRTSSAL